MKSHLRLGIAVAVNAMVFVLLVVFGILMKSSVLPSDIEAFFPDPVPEAEARIITRIISPAAVPAAQLRDSHVRVTGLIQCTAGQTLQLRARVTQGSTTATGEATYTCRGHIQRWVVHVTAGDGAEFVSGHASVHVWSSTLEDEHVHEWDDIVRLVGRP